MTKSPTLQGLRTVFRTPALWLAELAWRWSFGIGSFLLVALALMVLLDSVHLSKADLLFFQSKNPLLVAAAVANAFQGTGPRLLRMLAVLTPALAVLWTFAAAVGRTVTVKALLAGRQGNTQSGFRAVLGISFLRASVALAAVLGFAGAGLLAYVLAGPSNEAIIVFVVVAAVVAWAWGAVNWALVLAAIFPAISGSHTFGAIAAAMRLFRRRAGQFFATNTWFGLAHAALFVVAVFVAAHPAAMLGAYPRRAAALLIAIAFAYAAIIDFLYIARLAAYIAIAEDDRSLGDAVEPAPIIDAPSAVPSRT